MKGASLWVYYTVCQTKKKKEKKKEKAELLSCYGAGSRAQVLGSRAACGRQ